MANSKTKQAGSGRKLYQFSVSKAENPEVYDWLESQTSNRSWSIIGLINMYIRANGREFQQTDLHAQLAKGNFVAKAVVRFGPCEVGTDLSADSRPESSPAAYSAKAVQEPAAARAPAALTKSKTEQEEEDIDPGMFFGNML